MGKLTTRDDVITAIEAFDFTQKAFHQANAQLQTARNAGSATATLQGRVEHESAGERLLEAASQAETVLASYRAQTETDYRKSIEAVTVDSRRLHAERLVLEEQLADLKGEIVIVEEREKPLVDEAVEAQQTASTFAGNWERVIADAVKLTQAAA